MSFVFQTVGFRSAMFHWVGQDGRTACTGREVMAASFRPYLAVPGDQRCRGGGCRTHWRAAHQQRVEALEASLDVLGTPA